MAIIASVLSGFVIYANKLLPTTLINKLEFEYVPEMPISLITYPSIDSGPNDGLFTDRPLLYLPMMML